ncbi:hypothetical protein HUT16_10855 [Kitasatospora sp. NA04385]|uniref:hypothetical protein n=1 Tax=Kitasatospora sp. NA04385 TaxID=2742135 RepID=UPI001591C395|nr:hypothetical protein [Kitasatospora sp. NA04385]QKW19498.1 hypothetical protein HUT16_10855 [Kitasatospora sp. NA04385]
MLRAELDELLRARQFAAQRERRLAEAVRGGHEPDHAPAYGRPPRQPDPELVRQLAQAQNLREGLGARCLELSDRLLAAEDRQLAVRLAEAPAAHASAHAPGPNDAFGGQLGGPRSHRPTGLAEPTGPTAAPVLPQRSFPTGARFGGGHRPDPAHDFNSTAGGSTGTTDTTSTIGASASTAPPAADAPPLRGARFRTSRPLRSSRRNDDRGASPSAPPHTDTGPAGRDTAARGNGPSAGNDEHLGTSWARTHSPGDGLGGTKAPGTDSWRSDRPRTGRDNSTHDGRGNGSANNSSPDAGFQGAGAGAGTAPEAGGARLRTGAELIALVQRITDLHRQGAVHESAAIVGQVALMIAPADLVGLAALLHGEGPAGSSTYLARSVALGAPEHAAATLAELRREGLVEEAADLFHALWTVNAQALPALLAALEQSGQSADGQTLLWERASAPAGELSELARCLRASGRSGDVHHLLRQAAGRPVGEVATIAAALDEESAAELVRELVRMRSADDVGQFAAAVRDSVELYNAVLFATDGLEESRARSVFAALRTAGLPTEPAARPRSKSRQRR